MAPKTYVCPSVSLPPNLSVNRKRLRDNDKKMPQFQNETELNFMKSKRKFETSNFNELLSSIKDFSSKTLTGTDKMNYKNLKLTKLGLTEEKQQKMPFKIRMGMNAAKLRREKRKIDEARQSGLVLPTLKPKVAKKSKRLKEGKK